MSEKTRTDEFLLRGAWAHLTVLSLVETAMRARPDKLNFRDAESMKDWSDQIPHQATARSLSQMVTGFARQMLSLGLKQGDPVLLAMPNQVDGVVALMGVMAAGFLPCPVSVVASSAQIQAAAEAVGARAIVTVNRYAHLSPSVQAREAASRYYGIRFVCAFGPHSPEGIVALDGWDEKELWQGALPVIRPEMTALLTIDQHPEGLVAHRRSHAQLISEGLALSAVSGLTGRGTIIATFAPVSAAGVVSTVAAPLISGSAVTLHGPFDVALLASQLNEQPSALVVLPERIETLVRKALPDQLKDTIVIGRNNGAIKPAFKTERVTELLALGEVALLPMVRDQSRAKQKLPRRFVHPVSTALNPAMAQLECSVSDRGRLSLAGFGVATVYPAETATHSDRVVETRWLAHGDGPENISIMPDDEMQGVTDPQGFDDVGPLEIAAA